MKRKSGFRILSYNIHQGLTAQRSRLALSSLKNAVREQDADVVLLQEVAGATKKKKDGLGITSFQLEELADAIWPYMAYQRNSVFSGGFHGNAILSRFPIRSWKAIDITQSPLIKRGAIHAEISVPDQIEHLHIIATHLGLLQFERRRQLKKVCQYLVDCLEPGSSCILGGDFNDWRQIATGNLYKRLSLQEVYHSIHKKHALTFPAAFPVLRLDRIYFRGLKARSARVLKGQPWVSLSDHLPLIADFVV